jgi:spermidine/putrescine transport system permease protein
MASARGTGFPLTRALLWAWSALVYVFLLAPIVVVVVYSFNDNRVLAVWHGFTTSWYSAALHNEQILSSLELSALVAVLTAGVSLVLGTVTGFALVREDRRYAIALAVLLLVILMSPEIVDGIAYLAFDVTIGLSEPIPRLVIAHSMFGSAIVALLVRARLQRLDPSLDEAAGDLGAPPLRAFRQVTLPLLAPAVLAGGAIAFALSFDNVVLSSLVSTPGSTTLPVYIFSALRLGLTGDLAAIATLTLLLTLVLVVVALLVREARLGATVLDAE